MRVVNVHKAQPLTDRETESVTLVADEVMPSRGLTLDEILDLHTRNAKAIVDAWLRFLPGGTVDAVLRELLLARASHFVVPFGPDEIAREREGAMRAERICEEVAEVLGMHDRTYVPGALAAGVRALKADDDEGFASWAARQKGGR